MHWKQAEFEVNMRRYLTGEPIVWEPRISEALNGDLSHDHHILCTWRPMLFGLDLDLPRELTLDYLADRFESRPAAASSRSFDRTDRRDADRGSSASFYRYVPASTSSRRNGDVRRRYGDYEFEERLARDREHRRAVELPDADQIRREHNAVIQQELDRQRQRSRSRSRARSQSRPRYGGIRFHDTSGSPSPTRRREEIVELYANRDYEQVHTEEVVEHGRRREEVVEYSWGPDYDKVFVRDVYDYDGW